MRLPEQAQLYPLELLTTLAAELRSRDDVLIEGIRVVDVDIEDQSAVRTDAGTLTTGNVILATGIPILDRGLYFAKSTPQRHRLHLFAFGCPFWRIT